MASKCKLITTVFVIATLFVAGFSCFSSDEGKAYLDYMTLKCFPKAFLPDYFIDCHSDDCYTLNITLFLHVYKNDDLEDVQVPKTTDFEKDYKRPPSMPKLKLAIGDIYKYIWNFKAYFRSSKDRQLCQAIATRDPDKITKAIQSGCDPNAIGADGMPILFWSYFYGEEVVEALLKNGANPNVVLTSNYDIDSVFHIPGSSLLYTTIVFSTFQDPETNFFKDYPELLLKYGADPNFNDESPLTLALHWHEYDPNGGLIKLLLDKGADISRIDGRYRLGSPLLSAATRYDFGTVVELLKRGAETDPNEFVTRELQRSVCAYRSDYDAASDEERAEAKQYENYVKTVELLKEHGISREEPLAFESEFEKMHSRYWRLFGLGESVEEVYNKHLETLTSGAKATSRKNDETGAQSKSE